MVTHTINRLPYMEVLSRVYHAGNGSVRMATPVTSDQRGVDVRDERYRAHVQLHVVILAS